LISIPQNSKMKQTPLQSEKKSKLTNETKRFEFNKTGKLVGIAALVLILGIGFLYLRSDNFPQNQESITGAVTLDVGDSFTSEETPLEVPIEENTLTEEQKVNIAQDFLNQPLLFGENKGNYPPEVLYYVQSPESTYFYLIDKTILSYSDYALFINYIGANQDVSLTGEQPNKAKFNYFIGSNEDEWITDVSTFEQVKYTGLYDGVDVVVEDTGFGIQPIYYLAPHADPGQLQFNYEGADSFSITSEGHLEVLFGNHTLTVLKPTAYQEIDGQKTEVTVDYAVIDEFTYGFTIGDYDANYQLIIDPRTGS